MKARSKILVLLLTLALLCGILFVSASAAETTITGVTTYLSLQTAKVEDAGVVRGGPLTTHISDTGNAYYRHFYAKELAKNANQFSFGVSVAEYFKNSDKYLTMEFDFSTETHFDTSGTTSIVFLMRDSGPADVKKIYFGYNATDGNYIKLGDDGEKIKLEGMQPYEWHHITYVIEPKATVDTNYKVTSDTESRAVLYLDGKKVAEATGNIFPTGGSKLAEVRVQTSQSNVNRETGDLCLDNLIAKRVTSSYTGDLSAVMDGTANLGDYDGLFRWNDSYELPTGTRVMAKINETCYSDAQAAIDAAAEGDTVTLYEPISASHALTIAKNITVNAQGLEFNYSVDGFMVKKSGNLYTFEKVEDPASVTVKVKGDTVETGEFVAGESPASLTAGALRTSDRLLYTVSSWKITVDGTEVDYTATITEDMHGKNVVYTADECTRVAMTYTDASGKNHYIPYTTDAEATATFLQFFNYHTENKIPDGTTQMRFFGLDKLTLECDIVTEKGIDGSFYFGGSGHKVKNDAGETVDCVHSMSGKCVLDLNGHDLRLTKRGEMFPQFRANKAFYLVSSAPGARVIADEGGSALFKMWGAASVYVGSYEGTSGDNLSFYNFQLAYVGSSQITCNGGNYYLLKGGSLIEQIQSGTISNAKIYLGETFCGIFLTSGSNTSTATLSNVEIYSANSSNYIAYTSHTDAKTNLNMTGVLAFGVTALKGNNINLKTVTDCEFDDISMLPALDAGYVYARSAIVHTYDGFVDLDGKKITVRGSAYVKALETEVAKVEWTVDGTVVLTDYWMVGSVPFYTGGTITFRYRQDPDNEKNVLAPGDRWLIDGAEITAEKVTAGNTLTIAIELVSVKKAFEVTIDGVTTYYIDADYDVLYSVITGLTSAAKIRLYTDYTIPSGKALIFSVAGTELDLGGCKISTNYKFTDGFLRARAECYIYSSVPGAEIVAKIHQAAGGGGFVFGAYGGLLNVGFSKDRTYGKEYLTVDGTSLIILNGSNAVFNGITYINSAADNWGLIQYNSDNTRVEIENCDLWLTVSGKSLFAPRTDGATGGWSASINGSRIYTVAHLVNSGHGASQGKNPPGVTITDTILCSKDPMANDVNFPITFGAGVRMNQPNSFLVADGNTLARINEESVTLGGNPYTLLYEVVTDENAVKVIFMGGNTELATQIWKKGSIPSEYRADAFDGSSYYWYAKPTEKVNEDTTYPAKLKTTESKITGNLTLYANITFNLYFKNDGFIKGVKYNNVSHYFTEADEKNGYYYFPISDISPKDLSEAFTLEVILENGETTATYTVNTSLSKYASSVLASTESAEGKRLVMALLDYVYEMSIDADLGGKDATTSDGLKAIRKGLNYYKQSLNYEREAWDGTAPTTEAGNITDAALRLASTPGFIFYLDSTKYATAETVEVTINGVTKSYDVIHAEGDNHYIIVDDIHVSKYNDIMTVELDGTSFEYSLGAYMKGYTTIPEYAKALYNYVCAAKAYLKAQGN